MKEKEKNQAEHQKKLEQKSNKVKSGKKYSDILSRVIHEGEEMFKIKNMAIFLSAVIAGLEIGFSYILICTLYDLLGGSLEESTVFRVFGLVYPVGFILVILGKSALYTEQTSLLALPVLNGQRSILEMLRIWGLVISGNLIGGILFTLLIGTIAPHLGMFTLDTIASVGHHVLDYDAWLLFVSAVMAGWLMGLLTWLLQSTETSLTRMVIVFMITGVIGFVGFHHSIVGNIEAFGAYLYADSVSVWDYLWFLVLALVGNGVGGAVVVGLFKYRIFESNYKEKV